VRELATFPIGTLCKVTAEGSHIGHISLRVGDVVEYRRCQVICGDVTEIRVEARSGYSHWISYRYGWEFELI